MRQLWQIPCRIHVRRINVRNTRFLISTPHLRAPHQNPDSSTRSQLRLSSKATPRARKTPFKPMQQNQKSDSEWREAFAINAARWISGWRAWYDGSFLHRLAIYGILVFISGMTIIYLFVLERVPITGRRRFSWLPRFWLSRLEEAESQVTELLRKNEEKLFIKSEYPGLRKIEAVFNRIVKASGLDGIAWEVRVVDNPSMFFPMTVLVC